jgi:hypothetical protein
MRGVSDVSERCERMRAIGAGRRGPRERARKGGAAGTKSPRQVWSPDATGV